MAAWYWSDGAERYGPISSAELKRLAGVGMVVPQSLVWQEGLSDWIPAAKIRGLFAPVVAAPTASQPLPAAAVTQTTVASPATTTPIPRLAVPLPPLNVPTPIDLMNSLKALELPAGVDVLADLRAMDFRAEVIPVDHNNLRQIIGDYVFWGVTVIGIVPLLIGMLSHDGSQLTAFALFFALLWGVIFKSFIVRKDKDWLPLLGAMFWTGIFGVFGLLLMYALFLPRWYNEMSDSENPVVRLLGFIFNVGLLEELTKAAPVFLYLLWKRKAADPLTTILVGVFSGLGFAAFENMFYGQMFVTQSQTLTHHFGADGTEAGVRQAMAAVILRSLSCVFCHGLWSGIVAYFIAIGHATGKRRVALFLVGWAVAAVMHGLYDFLVGIHMLFAATVVAASFVLFYAYLSKLRIVLGLIIPPTPLA